VAQKAILAVFWKKSQLQSNKVCYKVSLCENFQQQSCTAIPLSIAVKYYREQPFNLKFSLKVTYPFKFLF